MSVSSINTNAVALQQVANNKSVDAKTPVAGQDSENTAVGGGAAGAFMAQPAQPGAGSLVKKMLVGGVLGAGVGFGASFLTLPVIGQVAAPLAAAVGAGVGALGGLAVHFLQKRKANLAMQPQAQAGVTMPTPIQTPPSGETLRMGDKGSSTRTLQKDLKSLGLFPTKLTGEFSTGTRTAIRRYEVMKGVVPTGIATPDVIAAIKQDAELARQNV